MPYFDSDRGRLHYRRWSLERPAATLVLLPGTGQHSGHYHRFAAALRPARIELWTLDTSGQGLSEGDPDAPGTLPELAADARLLLALAHAEHGSAPFLMGHSLGAATALTVAAEAHLGPAVGPDARPDIAVATEAGRDTAMTGGASPSAAPAAGGTPNPTVASGAGPDMAVDSGTSLSVAPDSAASSNVAVDSGASRDVGVAAGASAGIAGLVLCGTPRRGTEITLSPGLAVLAVHGVDDRRAPIDVIRLWTARHGSVDLREYADAGHDLLHEPVQQRVAADIAQWVLTCAR
ncbi:alpha/beta hydrolase [Nocardia sp. SSK8]|uniref:alpha/beta hydrolase n=1 Tax=Nocardia sp. SSK8 TaxID=3120154 RepID=UPI00300A41BE